MSATGWQSRPSNFPEEWRPSLTYWPYTRMCGHFIFLYLIVPKIFGEKSKLWIPTKDTDWINKSLSRKRCRASLCHSHLISLSLSLSHTHTHTHTHTQNPWSKYYYLVHARHIFLSGIWTFCRSCPWKPTTLSVKTATVKFTHKWYQKACFIKRPLGFRVAKFGLCSGNTHLNTQDK